MKFKTKRVRGFIFLLLGLFLFNSEVVAATKAPITGDFVPTTYKTKNLGKVKVDLHFSMLIPFKKVGVSLILPKGVRLIHGNKINTFNDLKTNEVQTLSYEFMVEDVKEKQIWATVKVLDLPDAVFSKDFLFTINPLKCAHPPAVFVEERSR